jgi:cellobiose phosphorylase
LPLLGFADWNDCVNLPYGAESLFIANLYGKALMELAELARYLGSDSDRDEFMALYETMKQRVNLHAWDGEWYIRYFDSKGAALGSAANTVGRLYANAQSWPVISGYAPADRALSGLDAVHRMLNTRYGIKLSTPGYDGFDPAVGGVSTFPPGAKENGGIFLHSNPWVIIAETIMGNGDRAYEYYAQINPAARNDSIDLYEVEPYVYAQNILGDEHPQFGLGRNSWLSGTAPWTYVAATQYILGIRPDHGGLLVDPCIPPGWRGFEVLRRFRDAVYTIRVENPDHTSKGVRSLRMDGAELEGCLLPVTEPGSEHTVHVVMG